LLSCRCCCCRCSVACGGGSGGIGGSGGGIGGIGGDGTSVVPTGVVVGILKPSYRQFVATFQIEEKEEAEEENNNNNNNNNNNKSASIGRNRYVLAVPMNQRIPKIRLRTRQYQKLKQHRLVVAIDHWDVDAMYPSGHVVRCIGARYDTCCWFL